MTVYRYANELKQIVKNENTVQEKSKPPTKLSKRNKKEMKISKSNLSDDIIVPKDMKCRLSEFKAANEIILSEVVSFCENNGIFVEVNSSNCIGGGALALDIESAECKTDI
jgi:histidinol phosphatase-like PHP family hydrolase